MASDADRLRELIEIDKRRLHERKKQKAYDGISADPIITLEIEDIEAQIDERSAELEAIEAGLDRYALIWRDFRSKVEKTLPGAKYVFQAIDLFQQLNLPLHRDMLIELCAKWDRSDTDKFKDILDEFERAILPKSANPERVEAIPAQCSNTGFRLKDDVINEVEAFFEVLRRYKASLDINLFFVGVHQFVNKADYSQMETSVKLWDFFENSELESVALFNLGVTYMNNSDNQKNFYLEAVQKFSPALSILPQLASKLLQQPTYLSLQESNQLRTKPNDLAPNDIIKACRYLNTKLVDAEGSRDQVEALSISVAYKAVEFFPWSEKAYRNIDWVLDDFDQPANAVKKLKQVMGMVDENDESSLYRAARIAYITSEVLLNQLGKTDRKSQIEAQLSEVEEKYKNLINKSSITAEQIDNTENRLSKLKYELDQLTQQETASQQTIIQKDREVNQLEDYLKELWKNAEFEQIEIDEAQVKIYNLKEQFEEFMREYQLILDEYQGSLNWAKKSYEAYPRKDTLELIEKIELKLKSLKRV